MADSKEPFSLNDPMGQTPNPQRSGASKESAKGGKSTSGYREGEILFSVPEPEKVTDREMTAAEKKKYQQTDMQSEQDRLNTLASNALRDSGIIQWPTWLKQAVNWTLLGIASVLLFLILGQATTFLAQFNSLPSWSQWVIGGGLVLVGAIILFLAFKLIALSIKLKKNDQINLAILQTLNDRQALQLLAQEEAQKAIVQLRSYLQSYPAGGEKETPLTSFDLETRNEITRIREKLLDSSQSLPSDKWLDLFRVGFQQPLDEQAGKLSKSYAQKVAIKTALSPLPLLDTGITLALSLSMIRDQMQLYNIRVGSFGAAVILVHAVGQAYVAGELQDISESFADSLSETIANQVGQTAAAVTKIAGSKAGEGLANGLMMYRLGLTTSRLLQPIRA